MNGIHAGVITDAELHHAHSVLKRYPSGLSRTDLARYFQSDRKGRDLMAALAERGIAPVVNVQSDYSDTRVYRLARTEDEVRDATRQLRAYIRSLEKRVAGLENAWNGAGQRQDALFQEAL